MRHFTLEYVHKLVKQQPKLASDRRPAPMPGKKWPTRVAWQITIAQKKLVGPLGSQTWQFRNHRTLGYVGKPNRYRAIQAWKFLNSVRTNNSAVLIDNWQAEFDKEGLVAYRTANKGDQSASGAFFAYHPHSAQVEVVDAFTRPLHLKYIGGMRLYSQKKKLTQEDVDAYYEWYHQNFKKRLRRPKSTALMTIGGEDVPVEPTA